jgi:hypothetical protein
MNAEMVTIDARAPAGSVTLDIGAGRGALVIYPSERFRDREIEISRVGEARRMHTGVHERPTQSGSVLTAIFGSLATGEYRVWEDATRCATGVVVGDGAVAEIVLL